MFRPASKLHSRHRYFANWRDFEDPPTQQLLVPESRRWLNPEEHSGQVRRRFTSLLDTAKVPKILLRVGPAFSAPGLNPS